MHGNVWEWCLDSWDEDAYRKRVDGWETRAWEGESPNRVLRGGSWVSAAGFCRSAIRIGSRSDRFTIASGSSASGSVRLQETREFELTDDRHRRTLEFLTHSGWVYWDPKLHQERVIVGQKWALDGIYTVLDPRPRSEIYRILSRRDGRFTLSQLAEWVWREAGYSPTEQELFLSFMLRGGLCFRLRKGPEAWREEDVFVSFEHLPTANELRLQRTFDSRHRDSNRERRSFWVPGMHKHHWQSFLTSAGNYYGKDARYALDGFYLEISYAWDLPVREGETGIPPGYEVPVDAIETFLRDTEPIQSPAGRGCACAHLRRISTRRRPSSTAWAGPMGGPCRG